MKSNFSLAIERPMADWETCLLLSLAHGLDRNILHPLTQSLVTLHIPHKGPNSDCERGDFGITGRALFRLPRGYCPYLDLNVFAYGGGVFLSFS